MSAQSNDQIRRLIPRWRYSGNSSELAETRSDRFPVDPAQIDERFWEEKFSAWHASRSTGAAAELVTAATILRRTEMVSDAIDELRRRAPDVHPEVVRLAEYASNLRVGQSIGARSTKSEDLSAMTMAVNARQVITASRSRLITDPRDALAWMDMARSYTVLGQGSSAERAMRRALMLAPDNRVVLRAAARRLIHAGEPDHAHALLVRHPRTRRDPWLMAAEIATSEVAERPSRFRKDAMRLLDSGSFSPGSLTELGAALGTLEFSNGSAKVAKKLLRASLVQPTDNVVAQARWLSTKLGSQLISVEAWQTPLSFEAWSWRAFFAKDWAAALSFAKQWAKDEPFSSRAAVHATFMATSMNAEYEYAIALAMQVLKSDPADRALINNLVVALVYADRVAEAEKILPSLHLGQMPTGQSCVELATSGLVAFRAGRIVEGRALYRRAFDCAPATLRVSVAAHWCREEVRIDPKASDALLGEVRRAALRMNDAVAGRVLDLVAAEPPAQIANPEFSLAGSNRDLPHLLLLSGS